MSEENALSADGLPENFWSVPENFIEDEGLRFLHSVMSARLIDENQGADTLELMAIERVATLYFYMRSIEMKGQNKISSTAAYKDMLKMWTTMAADLRKNRIASQDADAIRAEILGGVARAVNGAFAGIDPTVAIMAKKRIAERLESI